MHIKYIHIVNNSKSVTLCYEQGIIKSKTLRERLIILNRNLTLTHVISCINIKIKESNGLKILAILSNGSVVDLLELYSLNTMLTNLSNKSCIDSLNYGDSNVFIDKNGIRIVTDSVIKGGYISKSKKCLNIPWLLNLKSKLYIDDHREWLTA